MHAHHSVQVTLALSGWLRFRTSDTDDWGEYTGTVIASHRPHAFDGDGAPAFALIHVEPESALGRALTALYPGPDGIGVIPEERLGSVMPLFDPRTLTLPSGELITIAHEALHRLSAGADPPAPVDPRVVRALEIIRDHAGAPLTLAQVAASVHLSPGRFRHLFVEQVGMGFRPYLLWLRLKRAIEVVASGGSLTTAAHAAGFADSAHLSRTFRRMFGISAAAWT